MSGHAENRWKSVGRDSLKYKEMRGFIMAFAIVMGALLSYQCSKQQEKPVGQVSDAATREVPALAEQKGSDCDCGATQASCSADCWFTDCCICFSPTTHEAGCGCFLGFSSCKTEKLESTPELNGAKREHKIRLKEKNIREYFVFLSSIAVDISGLQKSFEALTREAIGTEYRNGIRKIIVPSSRYELFLETYQEFAQNLDAAQRLRVEQFLKTKKSK